MNNRDGMIYNYDWNLSPVVGTLHRKINCRMSEEWWSERSSLGLSPWCFNNPNSHILTKVSLLKTQIRFSVLCFKTFKGGQGEQKGKRGMGLIWTRDACSLVDESSLQGLAGKREESACCKHTLQPGATETGWALLQEWAILGKNTAWEKGVSCQAIGNSDTGTKP